MMKTDNKYIAPIQELIDEKIARAQKLKNDLARIEARLATIEKLRRNENAINFFLAPSKNGHKSFEESLFRKVQ